MTNFTHCHLMLWGQKLDMFQNVIESYVIVAIMSLLNIFIVLGNLAAILIVAYAKCATRRKQRDSVKVENGITKILMISMVISDAIFGVTGMPLMVIELYHSGHWTLGPTWCFIKVLAHYLWCPLVMCHVVCMAVDRFLAVCKPLVYRSLSFKLGYCLVGLCWGLSLLIVLTPMAAYWFNLEDNARPCSESNSVCDFMRSKAFVMLNYFFIGFSPITAILVLYFFIIREILRSSKRIANSCRNRNRMQPDNIDSLKSKTTFTNQIESEKGVERNVGILLASNRSKILTKTISHLCLFDAGLLSSGNATTVKNLIADEKTWQTAIDSSPQPLDVKQLLNSNVRIDRLTSSDPECAMPLSNTLPGPLDTNPLDTIRVDGSNVHGLNTRNNLRFSIISGATFKSNQRDQIGSITRTHCRGLRQMRAVRTIGLIVMFFSISWIPVFICLPIFTVTGSHLPSWLILVMIFCNYSNAAVNPVLFCCNPDCRVIIKSIVAKVLRSFRYK